MDFQENWFEDMDVPAPCLPRPSFLTANAFYWGIAVIFALLQLALPTVYWLLGALGDISRAGYAAAVQILMYLGVMLMPMAFYALSRPDERDALRLRAAPLSRVICAVVAAGFGYFAATFLAVLWMVLLESIGLSAASATDAFTGILTLDLVLIALLPAVCEEMVFRGMMLSAYERWGTWKAVWISAALFAGMHGSVAGFPVHLLLGVALGFVAASTGSLLPGMVLHGVYNAIVVFTAYRAPADPGLDLPLLEQLGGAMGVGVCAVMTLAFAALFIGMLRRMDRMRVRAGEAFGTVRTVERRKLGRSELVLLVSALATVVWFYLQDLLSMI